MYTLTRYDANNSADKAVMMRLYEIRQEVQPQISKLSAKATTIIATWNVRDLYQTGKLVQVIKEFQNYNPDILGDTEMRWTGSGKIKKKDTTILYSGPEKLYQKGVGIILNKEAKKELIDWKPVNDCIITARVQCRYTKTTVVVIQAPTEEAEEEEKDNFYDQCQDVFNEIPKHDKVLRSALRDVRVYRGADIAQRTQTSLRRPQDVLKRSRRFTTKQDVVKTSGKRPRIYNVLKTSDLRRLKDIEFTTS